MSHRLLGVDLQFINLKFNAIMSKHTITENDYIKATLKADREQEITKHGKVISLRPAKIHNSKKAYNRAKEKGIKTDD
jgi:hypothetical protein